MLDWLMFFVELYLFIGVVVAVLIWYFLDSFAPAPTSRYSWRKVLRASGAIFLWGWWLGDFIVYHIRDDVDFH